MSTVLDVIRVRLGHLFPIVVAVMLPPFLLQVVLLRVVLGEATLEIEPTGESSLRGLESSPIWWVLALAATLLTVLACLVTTLAFVRQFLMMMLGRPENWLDSLRLSLPRVPRYAGYSLGLAVGLLAGFTLCLFVIAGATFSPPLLGGVLLLTAFTVFATAMWLLLRLAPLPAVVVAGPSGSRSLPATFRLTSGRALAILGRTMLLMLFASAVRFALNFVPGAFAPQAIEPEPGRTLVISFEDAFGGPALMGISQFLDTFGLAFQIALISAAAVTFYLDLRGPLDDSFAEEGDSDVQQVGVDEA